MTYTGHGHHIPGTTFDDEQGQVPKARCGGVPLCSDCAKDTAAAHQVELPDPREIDVFDDADVYTDKFIKKAKLFVVGAYNNRVDTEDNEISVSDLLTVGSARVGDDWRVTVEMKDPDKGLYFDVIHNAKSLSTYVSTYMRIANDSFTQEGPDGGDHNTD